MKITEARFTLRTNGHTSATEIAAQYIRDHNSGVNAEKIPGNVISKLEACDGEHGPNEVIVAPRVITALDDGFVVFAAMMGASGLWTVIVQNGTVAD